MTRVVMTVDAVGGVWQYSVELARALIPLGYEVVLALLGPPPSSSQRAEIDAVAGVTLIDTGLALDWLAADEAAVRTAAAGVAALALRLGADLLHLNQPALAAEPMPLPTIVVAHSCVATWWAAVERGPLPNDLAWQARLTRAGLAAHPVACPSEAFADALMQAYALPLRPTVVHNGRTALAVFDAPLADYALTAGRLWDRGKNVATLDNAAAQLRVPLKAAGPTIGPNGDTIDLRHIVALGQLADTELHDRLAARPIFVSAALYEPFGLAVLEAALAGCPLVLSDIPTFRELWDDAAVFVAPRDAAGFAAAIDALIASPEQRREAGDRAQQRAARFIPAAMAASMAALYRDTLAAADRTRVAA